MRETSKNNSLSNTYSQVDPFEIGWLFVQEYYTHLNKDPARLHCFYNKKSCFLHGTEGETATIYHGQQVLAFF